MISIVEAGICDIFTQPLISCIFTIVPIQSSNVKQAMLMLKYPLAYSDSGQIHKKNNIQIGMTACIDHDMDINGANAYYCFVSTASQILIELIHCCSCFWHFTFQFSTTVLG